MFKKLDFKRLNYGELDKLDSHDLKRDEMHSFYLTFDFLDLIKKWPDIVGVKLSPFTSPLKIRQDSLFIITKHSIYSQELSFLAEPIKVQIFKVFPNLKPIIKKLVFQTQENYFDQKAEREKEKVKAEAPRLHPQSPQFKMRKLEAERLFSDIEDQELKELMISIFIQSK